MATSAQTSEDWLRKRRERDGLLEEDTWKLLKQCLMLWNNCVHFYVHGHTLSINLYICAIHLSQVQSPQARPNML